MSHEDAQAEQMAEAVYAAMEPLRDWFARIENGVPISGTKFEQAHEDVELLLMRLLDKYYGAGFKDGVAEEQMIQHSESYDE